jgi:hypothetical protein
MDRKTALAPLLVATAICILTSAQTWATDLDIIARHDVPGPVEVRVESLDGGGGLLLNAVLVWGNDDNSWGVRSLAIPQSTRTLRFTFINDFFTGPDPDLDRNAYFDFFVIDGEIREAESWDSTGGTDLMFPGCSVAVIDTRTVAECGNQNDYVEYLVFPHFWKADQPNYAPSGMPDFDQRQDQWAHEILCGPDLNPNSIAVGDDVDLGVPFPCPSPNEPVITKGANGIMETPLGGDDFYRYDYCAPTAVADCLWWFDSLFEDDPGGLPCDGADTYDLVTAYPGLPTPDDHCPDNVDHPSTPPGGIPPDVFTAFGELVEDLAWRMDTGGQRTGSGLSGTTAGEMEQAVAEYISERGLSDEYIVRRVRFPDFPFLSEELQRSQDLILGLSFVQNCQGQLQFVGGHAVTLAGVGPDPNDPQLCLSDPFLDLAELGSTGRVRPPIAHGHTGPPDTVHNDAEFISHDCNPVLPVGGPFGVIGLPAYANVVDESGGFEETGCDDIVNFFGQNRWDPDDPLFEVFPCDPACTLETVVTFVLEISPFDWKAGGLPDYAPSGVPDFDQRQGPFLCAHDPALWSYCGPVAVANSFWWFDSVFEISTTPPPTPVDNYPLVEDLFGGDDHDVLNVEPLIAMLAQKMNTDDQTAGWIPARGPFCGTYVEDMETGVRQHLVDAGLASEFYVNLVRRPTFDFVAAEVERSQDVILLLGFWQLQDHGGGPVWFRIGGHYVTAAGVDRPGGLIAFSDPILDATEVGLTPGRVRGILPHMHAGPPELYHNDAQNVSHDIYAAVPTVSPGGVWGPEDYAALLGGGVSNFVLQNSSDAIDAEEPPVGPPFGPEPIIAEVEFALEVSPCPREGDPGFVDQDGDGVADICDNCPFIFNPGQGPAAFGQMIVGREHCLVDTQLPCAVDADCPPAQTCDKAVFEWPIPLPFAHTIGTLPAAGYPWFSFATGAGGSFVAAATPSVGGGYWYLTKPDCPNVGSWQTVVGAQPARDATLP